MRISFCGDVCPAYSNEHFLAGDLETLFHDVPQEFAKSDRVVVNLECAITEANTPIEKIGPNLKAPLLRQTHRRPRTLRRTCR